MTYLEQIASIIIAPLVDAIRAGCQDIASAMRTGNPAVGDTPTPATPKRTRGANKEAPPPAEPATPEPESPAATETEVATVDPEEAAHAPKWTLEALKATFVAPIKDPAVRAKVKAMIKEKFDADALAVMDPKHYEAFAEEMRNFDSSSDDV